MSTNPYSKLSSSGQDFTSTIRHDTYPFIAPAQFDLTGRAVFITGASKGIGAASAISYARAGVSYLALGARSSMHEVESSVVSAAKEAGRTPPQVLLLDLDVTSEESARQAADKVKASFGRLDVLVNNAGYLETFVPLHKTQVDDWLRVWDVNIKGVYLVTRALLPLMLASKDSLRTVVNMSSIGANILTPGGSGYSMGKLALLRFGEFLNADYAADGVLSFGIHPGAVPTELALGMPKEIHAVLVDSPELAGDCIMWMTAERREWLAGRYVSVNWDMEELLGKREAIEKGDLLKVRLDVGLS